MKPTRKRVAAAVVAVVASALLSGCLVSRQDDYTVTLAPDGKSGTITVVQYDVESDQQEKAKQREDFDRMMNRWKSDAYLLERAKDGVYVKTRDLRRKGREMVWRETALFADVADVFPNDVSGDTLRITLDPGTTVLSTNGTIARADGRTIVIWRLPAKSLALSLRHDDFHPATDFAADFQRAKH